MVSKPFQRPFSLATRLTFFISLATIAAFFAFAWIMIHSVKVHFAEQDINDLKEISATLERVLNHPDETQARRLMTLEDIVSGYSNVLISLADSTVKRCITPPVRLISASLRAMPYPIKTRGAARCFSSPPDDDDARPRSRAYGTQQLADDQFASWPTG